MDKPFAITLDAGSSLANKTGSWRTQRPEYVDRLPPCNDACPAGEDVQGWLFHAESGQYERAWRRLTRDNPFPAIMGRVCYHACESACNRGRLDEAVGINAVERFLGDEALRRGWAFEPPARVSGRRVLVVGAGPSGLACAYHLRLLGHGVTVLDAGADAGGMMRYGIPRYRLPREILDGEIARLRELGVELRAGTRVEDVQSCMREGGFEAAFLAVGAQVGKHIDIPAGDAARVIDAVSLLRSMEGQGAPLLGRRVVVYGGGNTAVDAARTARRLGAEPVIVYRRTRGHMPAHDMEVEEAIEEGVQMKWLSAIRHADEGRIRIEKMVIDPQGRAQPTGEFEDLEADCLVLAVGQEADLGLVAGLADVRASGGLVPVGDDMMTAHPGIFAGGDMVPSARNATVAIGHGKKAARHIDAWLRGAPAAAVARHEIARFENLNTWYYSDAPKTVRPVLDIIRRRSTFDEVQGGLDEGNALFEARRCLSCGNCLECDNCYGMCPDNAVVKLGPGRRYRINLDYCKGCGICAAECPCGAIRMVPERI
jgi:NADPH-dependent glutamate synthase beta subunit-like oxidoreductase/Pyruvate/2-oxoacid:ferredoxin oxidoreductase delta subunit